MGFFGNIFKAAARGVRSLGGKAIRGLKSVGEKAIRGVKSGYQKVKGFITGKGKPKAKPWTEGDVPTGFVDVAGGKMAYKGGRPTGQFIKDAGRIEPKRPSMYAGLRGSKNRKIGDSDKWSSYVDRLTTAEDMML